MCDTETDLDLDLEFAEGEQVLGEQIPDELPVDGRYAGVAWGLAETGVKATRSS